VIDVYSAFEYFDGCHWLPDNHDLEVSPHAVMRVIHMRPSRGRRNIVFDSSYRVIFGSGFGIASLHLRSAQWALVGVLRLPRMRALAQRYGDTAANQAESLRATADSALRWRYLDHARRGHFAASASAALNAFLYR
jgi:hypothetical protein